MLVFPKARKRDFGTLVAGTKRRYFAYWHSTPLEHQQVCDQFMPNRRACWLNVQLKKQDTFYGRECFLHFACVFVLILRLNIKPMVFLLCPSHSPFPISSLDHRTFDPSIIYITSALFWFLALRHHHPCHRTMPASSFHRCITEKRVVFLVKILQLTSPHLSPHDGISTSLSILAPLHRQLKLFLIHTMTIILSTLLQKLFYRFYPFLNFTTFLPLQI